MLLCLLYFDMAGSTAKHFGLVAGLSSTGLVVLLLLVVSAWLLSHRKRQGTKQMGGDIINGRRDWQGGRAAEIHLHPAVAGD
jgi:hypothetical protein